MKSPRTTTITVAVIAASAVTNASAAPVAKICSNWSTTSTRSPPAAWSPTTPGRFGPLDQRVEDRDGVDGGHRGECHRQAQQARVITRRGRAGPLAGERGQQPCLTSDDLPTPEAPVTTNRPRS